MPIAQANFLHRPFPLFCNCEEEEDELLITELDWEGAEGDQTLVKGQRLLTDSELGSKHCALSVYDGIAQKNRLGVEASSWSLAWSLDISPEAYTGVLFRKHLGTFADPADNDSYMNLFPYYSWGFLWIHPKVLNENTRSFQWRETRSSWLTRQLTSEALTVNHYNERSVDPVQQHGETFSASFFRSLDLKLPLGVDAWTWQEAI